MSNTITQDGGSHLDPNQQFLHSIIGTILLPETEETTNKKNDENNDGISRILQEQRDAGSNEQDKANRVGELRKEQYKSR